MTGKEEFFQLVNEGREGHNVGLSTGSPKLDLYTDGFLPGTSYLIGGASGTGKSTWSLWTYVYQPLIHYLNGEESERDPHWLLFSLEMTRAQVYAKLVSMYIFDQFGIELKFKQIFSRGKDCTLTDDEYELLVKCSDFIDILDGRLTIYEGSLNEAIFLKEIDKELAKWGKFIDGKFIPNNPLMILGVLLDHVTLIKASNGRTKKEEIDAISRDSVQIRNNTKIVSPIFISQFNRNANGQERMKQGLQDPSMEDYKDSGSLLEDSMVAIGLYSPHKFKLSSYKKYNIKILEQCFIGTFILKSRFGSSDLMIPTGFYGDCSHYADLPKPDNIFDWEQYTNPNWLLKEGLKDINVDKIEELDTPENIDVKEEDNNINSKFSFVL